MNETELESLVVRLTGDGSEYAKMLQQAQVNTNAAAAQVQQAATRIEGFSARMGTFASGAVSALAALGAGNWLRSALGEWQTAERTAMALESAIRSNGNAVESLMRQYNEFASSMEELSVLGDDTTLSMLRQAESFNLSGDAAVRATQDAIALQAATTGSAQGAEHLIRLTAALTSGNIQQAMSMARMVPQLRGITDEAEFVARAQRLIAGGMGAAAAEAQSFSGQLAQLKNAYGNLLEDIGQTVATVISPVVAGIKSMVNWFRDLSPEIKRVVTVVAMLAAGFVALGPILAIMPTIVAAFAPLLGVVGGVASFLAGIPALIAGIPALLAGIPAVLAGLLPIVLPFLVKLGILVAVLGTVAALVKVWIDRMGGLAAVGTMLKDKLLTAWENIKTVGVAVWGFISRAARRFWSEVGPIVEAGVSFLMTAWEKAKTIAGETWDWIKAKVLAFWDWARPIVAAGISFMITSWQIAKEMAIIAWEGIKAGAEWLWNGIKAIFTVVKDFIFGIWESIFGKSETTWDDIAAAIATAITAAEFALKNFDKIASYVWTLTKLGFAGLVNDIEYFFTTKLPAWLGWFAENFVSIHVDAFNFVGTALNNLSTSVANVFVNLPGLIAGTTDWSEVWTPLAQGFQATMTALPRVAQREMGALERDLANQAAAQAAELQQLWNDFELQQLADLAPDAETERQAEKAGEQIGKEFSKGVEKGMERFDGVLASSAEAITRLAEYRDRLGLGRIGGTGPGGASGSSSSGVSVSQSTSSSSSNPGQREVVLVLNQIKDHLKTLVDRPQIQIAGADLG